MALFPGRMETSRLAVRFGVKWPGGSGVLSVYEVSEVMVWGDVSFPDEFGWNWTIRRADFDEWDSLFNHMGGLLASDALLREVSRLLSGKLDGATLEVDDEWRPE